MKPENPEQSEESGPLPEGELSVIDVVCNPGKTEAEDVVLRPMSKRRIMKNLLILGTCFLTFFLGFQGLATLQSTMNSQKGVGMDSQAVIYGFSMLSAILISKLMIKRLGCKITLVLTIAASCSYIAANYYPYRQSLLPAAVVFGLANGPLSTAQGVYVNELSFRYKVHVSDSLEEILAKFYGIYSFFSESTQIWGNLISYYVLKPHIHSAVIHPSQEEKCGILFENSLNASNDSNPYLHPPSDAKRYLLVSIYLFLCALSVLIMCMFLDSFKKDQQVYTHAKEEEDSVLGSLLAAAKHVANPNQILLLPITVYIGMQVAFYTGDFTQAYIACAWGIHHVGFVTMCFGAGGVLMAFLVGPLVRLTSQTVVFIIATLINASSYAVLFLWQPASDHTAGFFIIAGGWGIADTIWWSQTAALYGLIFPTKREAALSNFYFWTFLGYLLSYSFANHFTVALKISVLLCFLTTGMIGYLMALLRSHCTERPVFVVLENE